MKIFDCFIFNHEIELLEIRLNIMDSVVDKFVITEGDKTFSGKPKTSHYLENKERFFKWEHKIIHNLITLPDANIPWDREIYSRNSALNLPIYEDEDLILMSDLDEIPNPKIIAEADKWVQSDGHFTFQQKCYTYYLNNFYSDKWFGTRAATYKYMKNKTIDDVREGTEDLSKLTGYLVSNGGWHFTYCGGTDMIKHKIDSFCDTQYNHPQILDNIDNNLNANQDIFFRGFRYQTMPIDNTFPDYILENQEKYKHLIK